MAAAVAHVAAKGVVASLVAVASPAEVAPVVVPEGALVVVRVAADQIVANSSRPSRLRLAQHEMRFVATPNPCATRRVSWPAAACSPGLSGSAIRSPVPQSCLALSSRSCMSLRRAHGISHSSPSRCGQ